MSEIKSYLQQVKQNKKKIVGSLTAMTIMVFAFQNCTQQPSTRVMPSTENINQNQEQQSTQNEEQIKNRVCIAATQTRKSIVSQKYQEYPVNDAMVVSDTKYLEHTSQNEGDSNHVAVQRMASYTLFVLNRADYTATTPSTILLEGELSDYEIIRDDFPNKIYFKSKVCGGKVLNAVSQTANSTGQFEMSVNFKNCQLRIRYEANQYSQSNPQDYGKWTIVSSGQSIPLNATTQISGCVSSDNTVAHEKYFSW